MKEITTWSYSRLKAYESCPLKAYLLYVEKRPDDHMNKDALNRGIEVHTACELFVKGEGDFTKDMAKFRDYFADLKVQYEGGAVVLEEDWGFTRDWEITGWWDDDVWCRMKLDNFIKYDEDCTAGAATDYKTGKIFGNEVSHGQQGQLYALGSFLRYASLQTCDVVFQYLDHGKTTKKTYTREQAMVFLPMWNKRASKMTDATDYPPKPNKMTCMWCPFGPQNGDSSCEWGV